MSKLQSEVWSSEFGKEYTDRNPQTVEQMDALYQKSYGVTRTALNLEFLGALDRGIRILEIGSNVGTQLVALQSMGFRNLFGIEVQSYACEVARRITKGLNIIQANALDIPFPDGDFDLVYTSGVLIHISPRDLPAVQSEMWRCSRGLVWGFEYFAESHHAISYRGKSDLMWKGDFCRLFLEKFPEAKLLTKKLIPYVDRPDLVDCMYLIGKR